MTYRDPASAGSEPRSVRRLRRAGEACLWVLVIGVTGVGAAWLAWRLKLVVLPVLFALVLATFLRPPARWLARHGWPAGLAAISVMAAGLLVVGGVGAVVVPPAVEQLGKLDVSLGGGLTQVEGWLAGGPLTERQAHTVVGRVQDAVSSNIDTIAGQAVSGALLTLEILGGLALTAVLLFFFLKDGERIWAWLAGLAPAQQRATVEQMGRRAWAGLGGYVRGQTVTALFDAVFIGMALWVLGVPLVLPLAVITFIGGYVPIAGATAAGAAAALVALVADGLGTAIGVVVAVLIVQQMEGNVFHPYVVGRSISVHPIAILLAVTAGGVLGGILGAMVAAPTVAVGAAVLAVARDRAAADRVGDDGGAVVATGAERRWERAPRAPRATRSAPER